MGTDKRERQKANRALKYEQQSKEDRREKTKRTFLRGGIFVVLAVIAVVAIALISQSGDDEDDTDTLDTSGTTVQAGTDVTAIGNFTFGSGECAPETKPADAPATFEAAPRLCINPSSTYTATFDTSEGKIVVSLDAANAPGTVNNFVQLAKWGFYDGTPIFRADKSIDIIQGGGENNTSDVGYTIPDEGTGYTYTPGVLAMARTQQPNSAGGQWFFGVDDNVSNLDAQGTYVAFGEVTEGLEVAKKILDLSSGDADGTLTKQVDLKSVTIAES